MSEQMKKEILKSFVYGMTIEDMSDIYELSADELRTILNDNAAEIAELKKYRAELEG